MQNSGVVMRIKGLLFLLVIISQIPFAFRTGAAEPIPVVTTLPVLKDLVEAVGGSHVQVSALISGFESEHTYTPKPSDLFSIQNAAILFKIGLGLETWVNPLIENAGRSDLLIIISSEDVPLIQGKDLHADDIEHHAEGNPHIWLDPSNVRIMVQHIKNSLIRIDPTHESDYVENAAQYRHQLETLETDLLEKVKGLTDKRIITHHPAWPYFAARFGFVIKGNILTQVGSEPSAKKMASLIQLIKKENIQVIVSEPQLNQKIPMILAEETGVHIVSLSPISGAISGTDRYLDLIRYNVETLVAALEKPN